MLFIVFLVLLLDSTDTTLTANTNCPDGATAFNCNNTFPDAICSFFGQPDPATNQINTGCYDINNCRGSSCPCLISVLGATYTYYQQNCQYACGSCCLVTTTTATTTTTAAAVITTTTASTGTSCTDNTNCAIWGKNGFCTSALYTAAQKKANCPNICGLCSPAPTCTDNISCATWVQNGFCTSSFYTTAQKSSYCPNRCGLCVGK